MEIPNCRRCRALKVKTRPPPAAGLRQQPIQRNQAHGVIPLLDQTDCAAARQVEVPRSCPARQGLGQPGLSRCPGRTCPHGCTRTSATANPCSGWKAQPWLPAMTQSHASAPPRPPSRSSLDSGNQASSPASRRPAWRPSIGAPRSGLRSEIDEFGPLYLSSFVAILSPYALALRSVVRSMRARGGASARQPRSGQAPSRPARSGPAVSCVMDVSCSRCLKPVQRLWAFKVQSGRITPEEGVLPPSAVGGCCHPPEGRGKAARSYPSVASASTSSPRKTSCCWASMLSCPGRHWNAKSRRQDHPRRRPRRAQGEDLSSRGRSAETSGEIGALLANRTPPDLL